MTTILESIDNLIYSDQDEELLTEIKFKKVVRHGQIVKKVVCPEGFKVDGMRCVRMQSAEMRKRQKAAKKAVKTKKRTFKGMNRMLADKSRMKSERLRKMRHL